MQINQYNNNDIDNKNIILWYPISNNDKVLEIGGNNEKITESLLQKAQKVTNIIFEDEIKDKYSCIKNKRLELIVQNTIEEIKVDEKYDYIILIEVEKYLKKIFPDLSITILDILKLCKDKLTEKGKILLIENNRLGVKNFCGNFEEEEDYLFQNLEGKNNKYNFYTKNELIIIIEKLNFDYKFFYPFPNYKNANVIFSEKSLQDKKNSKINYNPLYGQNSKIILDEINLIKQFANNNIIDLFSNSFFVEIYNKNNNEIESNIDFVSFNNLRKEKYKTLLTIEKEYAIKRAYSDQAKGHIENIVNNSNILKNNGFNVLEEINDEDSVKTKYISNDKLLDNILVETLENGRIEQFFDLIDKYYNQCLNKLEKSDIKNKILDINIENDICSELHFLKNGFIDLVFENIFYQDDEFIIYDQEWNFENIPLEFVLYRAITNLYVHNTHLEQILKYDKVLEYYKLDKYKDLFDKVEKNIQTFVVESSNLEKYKDKIKINILEQDKQINYLREINLKSNFEIQNLSKENLELKKQIEQLNNFKLEVINSRSWKLTQKIKRIFSGKKI